MIRILCGGVQTHSISGRADFSGNANPVASVPVNKPVVPAQGGGSGSGGGVAAPVRPGQAPALKPVSTFEPTVDPGVRVMAAASKVVAAETALPGLISDVAIAGGGRYLVCGIEGLQMLAIYDAESAAVVRTIRLTSDDYLFAAGGERILVYQKDNNLLASYDLVTGKRLQSKLLPYEGVACTLTMGHSRGDRAFVRIAKGTDALDRCTQQLIAVDDLVPIDMGPGQGGANGLNAHNIT